MRPFVIFSLLALLAGCASKIPPLPDYVQVTSAPPFKPPPPTEKMWDWIQLTSDEWLKGELKYMRNYTLEIDSDELNDLTFAWRKIKVVKSPRYMSILLDNQATVRGPVIVQDDKVVVKQGEKFAVFPREHMLTLVPGGKSEASYWSGKIGFGATIRSGNVDQIDLSLSAWVRRRGPRSRLSFDFIGAYGEVNEERTISQQRFVGRWDLYIAARWFVTPAALELYRDPFQNIRLRATPLGGVGYYIFKKGLDKQSICDWDVTFLAGYRFTRFESGEEDSTTATVGGATNLDWSITPKIDLRLNYDLQVGVRDIEDTNQNLTVSFQWDVFKDFEVDLKFIWNYVGKPRPDENGDVPLNSDFRMVFEFAWEW